MCFFKDIVAILIRKACLGLQVSLYITTKNILDLIDSIPTKKIEIEIFYHAVNIFEHLLIFLFLFSK